MKESLKDRVIVITGASAGLGRAMVREFARKGARLGLIARGTDGLEAARREAELLGAWAHVVPLDVSDPQALDHAADEIEKVLGPIAIWINNAMISVFGPVHEIGADEYKRVTEVTYLGQVYGTMAALKKMRPRNTGKIILIGSALAYRGIPLQSAYCGAKHAILGFFESLRAELIHEESDIHLCMVQMPAMNTTQFEFVRNYLPNKPRPMGTIYDPELAAKVVVYAACHYEREIQFAPSTIKTILGNKVLPGYLDRYLAETGYCGQQTCEPEDKNKDNNLWRPFPGDHGARGPFVRKSRQHSLQFGLKKNKRLVAALAVTFFIAACTRKLISGHNED